VIFFGASTAGRLFVIDGGVVHLHAVVGTFFVVVPTVSTR
jgi:hypothetical protein